MAKPIWFKVKGSKWHKDDLKYFDTMRRIPVPHPEDVLRGEEPLESRCSAYKERGDKRAYVGKVPDWDKEVGVVADIRKTKPKDNLCATCDKSSS